MIHQNRPKNMAEKPSDLYDLLGVHQSATQQEILQAYKLKARQYHPDKNPSINEELMKSLNQAKEVLTDKIRRREYDEQADDDGSSVNPSTLISILQGHKLSVFFEQQFQRDLKTRPTLQKVPNHLLYEMTQTIRKEANGYLKRVPFTPQRKPKSPPVEYNTSYKDVTDSLQSCFSCDELGNKKCDPEIFQVLQLMHTKPNTISPATCEPGASVPILDIHCLDVSHARLLLKQFLLPQKLTSKEAATLEDPPILNNFIPKTTLEEPPPKQPSTSCNKCNSKSSLTTCMPCGLKYCKKCLPVNKKLPRKGILKPTLICESCHNSNEKHDLSDWLMLSEKLLKADKSNETLYTATGCLTLALHCDRPKIEILQKTANLLLSSVHPHMALPFIASSFSIRNRSPKEQLLAHSQMARFCLIMANDKNEEFDDKKIYLEIARQAIDTAMLDTRLEMPVLAKQKQEIKSRSVSLNDEIKVFSTKWINETHKMMEEAWYTRDWLELLNVLHDQSQDTQAVDSITGRKTIEEAVDNFLKDKKCFINRMQDNDKYGVMFLQGESLCRKGQFELGLADIETAAWSGFHSDWLVDSALDIFLNHFEQTGTNISHHYANACSELVEYIENRLVKKQMPQNRPKLIPKQKDALNPLDVKSNWPAFYVSGHDIKAIKMYEKAISKGVTNGQFDEHQAGLSYIDLVQACSHPAEIALCLVQASMWFYQQLSKKSKSSSNSELNALKELILRCITITVTINMHSSLHPAMQYHVARTGLAIAIDTISLTEQCINHENTQLIELLVHSVLYNCRFCPFWEMPATRPSEAILLHLISGESHCKFLLRLLSLNNSIPWPVEKHELHYQMYENVLRHVCDSHTESVETCRETAMHELLNAEGLSWENVANSIISPMTPRDKDGWLIPQNHLGADLPYSSIKGFEFDFDSSSPGIKMLYEKNRPGVFSMSDVNEALMHGDEEYFVSLDPPNIDQQFHPFQKIRSISSLKGTRCLYTMLHADYLLKSFSVGVEVSANPPFNQRPCSKSLIAHLPKHLQKVLQSVTERGYTLNQAHRFWIQAGELTMQIDQKSDAKVEFKVAEPKMFVRTHLLQLGRDGTLEDTKEDEDPNSPEAQFAADLTKHYDELEKYFPIFKRLKELTKLKFLRGVLKSVQESLRKNAAMEEENRRKAVVEFLPKARNDAKAHYTQQAEGLLQTLVTQIVEGIKEISRPYSNYSTTEDDLYLQVAELMKAQLNVYKSKYDIAQSLKQYVMELGSQRYGTPAKDELIEMMIRDKPLPTEADILAQIGLKHKHRCQNFNHYVDALMRSAAKEVKVKTSKECIWVPAAMNVDEDKKSIVSICYGGVVLQPTRVKQGTVSYQLRNATSVILNPHGNSSTSWSLSLSNNRTAGNGNRGGSNSSTFGGGSNSGQGNGNGSSDGGGGWYRSGLPLILTASFLATNSSGNDDKNKPRTLNASLNNLRAKINEGATNRETLSTQNLCTSTGFKFSNDNVLIKATGEVLNRQNLPQQQHGQVKNCVYAITDKTTGETYIGLTTRKLDKRLKEHIRDPKSSVHKHFTNEKGQLRQQDMVVTVLHHDERISRKELHKVEGGWINKRGFPEINTRKAFTENDIAQRKKDMETQ